MELYDAIKDRFSCRRYIDKPIEKDKLDRILNAARLAPSAKNVQDWRFVIITDAGMKTKIAQAAGQQMFIADAAVIIVACTCRTDYIMRCGIPAGVVDVSIALEHIALAATAEGLAACWIGAFDQQAVKTLVSVPPSASIVELMPVGYPASKPIHTPRADITDIACFEQWNF